MTAEQLQWQTLAVLGLAFAASLVLGFVLHRSHFCAMGAVSDWLLMGNAQRARQWALALAVAILGFAGLMLWSGISPLNTIYNTQRLPWLSLLLGGWLFGVGMVLGSGCASKALVRLGAGNLKSLVVLMAMGMAAVATLRGLPAVWRVQGADRVDTAWGVGPFASQWLAHFAGWSLPWASAALALCLAFGLVVWVGRDPSFRAGRHVFAGIGVGLVAVLLWWCSGVLAWVPEHPETLESVFLTTASGRMESMSFVGPVGFWLDAFMYYSDGTKRVSFGMAMLPGVVLGAALSAWRSGSFRWEGFTQPQDLVRHLVGGVLMGVGGVMALGCTFGQGLSGLSTLNLGSVLATAGIVLGAVLTLKWQMAHD
ncbi:YeeE/YedE family protein [Limnohabitans radicicola]|uniref:YeeE/YedE family protein n=1 Tax=Limnohabitans radicicola TaxID=2771427 RepID=A0A927ILY1_9BURK|nr:YeeE/YedE family protein [Limnohabitans radicicola]MBD8051188.1 YeeE/YedE family protein [Limnohabitans radicicola]